MRKGTLGPVWTFKSCTALAISSSFLPEWCDQQMPDSEARNLHTPLTCQPGFLQPHMVTATLPVPQDALSSGILNYIWVSSLFEQHLQSVDGFPTSVSLVRPGFALLSQPNRWEVTTPSKVQGLGHVPSARTWAETRGSFCWTVLLPCRLGGGTRHANTNIFQLFCIT